jgi:hypothetical protein
LDLSQKHNFDLDQKISIDCLVVGTRRIANDANSRGYSSASDVRFVPKSGLMHGRNLLFSRTHIQGALIQINGRQQLDVCFMPKADIASHFSRWLLGLSSSSRFQRRNVHGEYFRRSG